jgi:hypothetical protein
MAKKLLSRERNNGSEEPGTPRPNKRIMGGTLSVEAESKAAGTKLAISRLSDEYLSFVEVTTVEVRERESEVPRSRSFVQFYHDQAIFGALRVHFLDTSCNMSHVWKYLLSFHSITPEIVLQLLPPSPTLTSLYPKSNVDGR